MKKVISIIISLVLSIIAIVAVLFLTLNIFKSPKTLPKIAKIANYYDESYPLLLDSLKNEVGNEKLQGVLEKVVTKKRVTEDIGKIFDNGSEIKDTLGDNLTNELLNAYKEELKDNYDNDALTNLTKLVGNSYKQSIFPNDEFGALYKVINKIPAITIIFVATLIIYLFISLVLLIWVSNGYKIVAIANYITALFLLFPYLFVNLSGLINKFYYTNLYWTIFIKKAVFFLLRAFAIAGLVFIVLGIIVQIMEHIIKKEK